MKITIGIYHGMRPRQIETNRLFRDDDCYLNADGVTLINIVWSNHPYWERLEDEDYSIKYATYGRRVALRESDSLRNNQLIRDCVDSCIMMMLTTSGIPPHMRAAAMLMGELPVIDTYKRNV